eukprot:scaffold3450_cov114-Cylindrotheca_fusiformis.AAC.33
MALQETEHHQEEDHESMPSEIEGISELPGSPSKWPQRPLLVRPTPNTATEITRIRYSSGADFLEDEGFAESGSLPINGGKECLGRSVIVDFHSSQFVGSLMIRIRDAPKLESIQYQSSSYFDGKKRTFQAVIRGRFRLPLVMRNCVTGQTFRRAGKLPSRWIVNSFVKIFSILAPHLEIDLRSKHPRFLAPLCATAQTVLVERRPEVADLACLDKTFVEPLATSRSSVLWEEGASHASGSKPNESVPSRDMLDFKDDISIKMGRPLGSFSVSQITDGQPIKFMSAYRGQSRNDLEYLWSFDIWHESFFPLASQAHRRGT